MACSEAKLVRESYKNYFEYRAKQVSWVGIGDWVYVDDQPNRTLQNSLDNPSRKLIPRKIEPCHLHLKHYHTAAVAEDGVLNMESTDCLKLQNRLDTELRQVLRMEQ